MGLASRGEVETPDGHNTPLRERQGNPATSVAVSNNDSFKKLFRHHLRDWFAVFVVAILEIIVYVVIPPFHRYVGENNIEDYRYPRKKTTVPTWSVLLIAVFIPLIVFFLFFLRQRSARDFHNAFLGLGTAIALTALLTDSIKNCVGMPRPDFFHRCFPDNIAKYNPNSFEVICHGSKRDIRDGYKSFPSGHASWSYAGLGYLSLYLIGKLGVFDKRGWTWRVVVIFLPMLAATLVAVSRVDDYQHSWWDVVFGALIGLSVCYFTYRTHYPSFYADNVGIPYQCIPGTEAHSKVPTVPTRQTRGAEDPALKDGPAANADIETGRRSL